MAFRAFVFPLQELAKGGPTMAVFGLLFGGELGEGLADLREVEERIVAEAVGAARRAQNETFSAAVKGRQRVAVPRDRDHADKTAGTILVGNIVQLAQQASVVRFVAGIRR